ncbi:MAG: TatD family hydrolase [Waddliaceae bacterium]|nr:TatD family hydrolase [Waddliaceae bacterium]
MGDTLGFIDSHAHLTCKELIDQDAVDDIVGRAHDSGVEAIVNICTDEDSLQKGLDLHKKYSWIYNAAATTPHDVEKDGEAFFPVVEKHARDGAIVAIGETGLDYHYNYSTPEIQRDFFRRYLRLAKTYGLPVIIHCREAFDDLFSIADEEYRGLPAVLHCFTGTMSDAEKVLDRGWYISLSGIVTFKRSDDLRKVAEMVPLGRLLIETDTPYLAPQKYRGQKNEPAYVIEVADTIARIKNIPRNIIAEETSANARALFL